MSADFTPITVELSRPVHFGAEDVTAIVFKREPLCADMKDVSLMDFGVKDMIRVASRITGYPPAFFDKLSARDTFVVIEVVSGFFGAGPQTG